MEVVIAPVPELSRIGADAVERLLRTHSDPVLGLATGSSPLALYDELVRRHTQEGLSFAHAVAFTLDEYIGLAEEHPERYAAVIRREFTGRVDFSAGAVHGPDGLAEDLAGAARAYEEAIVAAGGVDLQILGIGTDGHIAFNEPGSSLASRTRVKTLAPQTRVDNARFFGGDIEQVPVHCLTQGVGTIMAARHLLLLASGSSKAEAVAATVEGPVSAACPGSALQFHPHVTILIDDAAASRLRFRDYYQDAWAHRLHTQSL